MADMFCRHCGLIATANELECPRCGSERGTVVRAFYDPQTGDPLDPESPPQLRCWHCGRPIEQQQTTCPHCSIALTDRKSGADRYDVVPRSSVGPPLSGGEPNRSTAARLGATRSIPPTAPPFDNARFLIALGCVVVGQSRCYGIWGDHVPQ